MYSEILLSILIAWWLVSDSEAKGSSIGLYVGIVAGIVAICVGCLRTIEFFNKRAKATGAEDLATRVRRLRDIADMYPTTVFTSEDLAVKMGIALSESRPVIAEACNQHIIKSTGANRYVKYTTGR